MGVASDMQPPCSNGPPPRGTAWAGGVEGGLAGGADRADPPLPGSLAADPSRRAVLGSALDLAASTAAHAKSVHGVVMASTQRLLGVAMFPHLMRSSLVTAIPSTSASSRRSSGIEPQGPGPSITTSPGSTRRPGGGRSTSRRCGARRAVAGREGRAGPRPREVAAHPIPGAAAGRSAPAHMKQQEGVSAGSPGRGWAATGAPRLPGDTRNEQ